MAASAVSEARSLLSLFSPTFLGYYPHNVASSYSFSRSPAAFSTLASTSISALALAHRRMLNKTRTLPYLRAVALVEKEKTGEGKSPPIPKRDWPEPLHHFPLFGPAGEAHVHRWVVSNQMTAGETAELSFPDINSERDLPLIHYLAAVVSPIPLTLDHVVGFQWGQDGVGMIVNMRESRWKSVVRAMDQLEWEV
jgi:hypothetical protein